MLGATWSVAAHGSSAAGGVPPIRMRKVECRGPVVAHILLDHAARALACPCVLERHVEVEAGSAGNSMDVPRGGARIRHRICQTVSHRRSESLRRAPSVRARTRLLSGGPELRLALGKAAAKRPGLRPQSIVAAASEAGESAWRVCAYHTIKAKESAVPFGEAFRAVPRTCRTRRPEALKA